MSMSNENQINVPVRSTHPKGRSASDAIRIDDFAPTVAPTIRTMAERRMHTALMDITSPTTTAAATTVTTTMSASGAPAFIGASFPEATMLWPGTAAAANASVASVEDHPLNRREDEEEGVELEEKTKDASQLELDKLFDEQQERKFDDCPEYQHPIGFKEGIVLFPHQRDGVRWLVHQEKSRDRLLPFYKQVTLGMNQKQWWNCTLNNKKIPYDRPPYAPPSSILADDMGLGKTIQTIGLILCNPPEVEGEAKCNLIVAPKSVIAAWKTQINRFVQKGHLKVAEYSGSHREAVLRKVKRNNIDILLVTYETLASDFKAYQEFQEDEEKSKKQRAATKKNPKKKAKRSQLAAAWNRSNSNYDSESDFDPDEEDSEDDDDHYLPPAVVRKPRRKPSNWIFRIRFHRIVLDEGHTVRNSDTKRFSAVMELDSLNKLVISGTIYVNRPSDLQSLFKFLGAEPLSDETLFEEKITLPIKNFKEIGLSRVRTMVSFLALRRTKDILNDAIQLPQKDLVVRYCQWDQDDAYHGVRHDILYRMVRAVYASLKGGRGRKGCIPQGSFMRLFAWVIRCRQSNVHGTLIPDDVVQTAQDILNTLEESELTDDHDLKFDLTTEEGQALLAKIMLSLRVSEGDDSQEYSDCTCDVCFEDLDEESVRILQHCRHIFCCNCLDTIKSKGSSKCPVCRQTFGKKDIISKAVAEEAAKNAAAEEDKKSKNKSEPSKSAGKHQMHPKEVAVLDELSNMDPDCKAVIFSEWTSVLDIIQGTIERHGYVTTRIDGSMDTDERVAAIENFESDHPGSPRVILCSTMATGVGITLTRGSLAILMEPYWNEAIEEQAWCRIYRIGQSRTVRIVRLIMKDSLEQRMLEKVQLGKAHVGKGSQAKLSKAERELARLTAMKDLFELDGAKQKWEGVYADEQDANSNLDGFIVDDDDVKFDE